jgi:hypothetical protein
MNAKFSQKSRVRRASRLFKLWIAERLRSVPLELADFVLDAELLALQIVDCVLIR